MNYPKKASYKTYKLGLVKVLEPGLFQRHRMLVLRGDCEFLLIDTIRLLRQLYESKSWTVERWEANQINAERFSLAISAVSMFEPKTLTVIDQAQSKTDLLQYFHGLSNAREIQNPICLIWRGGELSAKIQKEFERLEAHILPCDAPTPWELREFVSDLASRYGLNLKTDAIELLQEATGTDLFKLNNEMNRISLCFAKRQTPISCRDLLPFLGFLREDHVFKLDQFLCNEDYSRAFLLLQDLLDRGEHALSLLAILAMHCRKSLQISAGIRKGLNPAELAKSVRIPPSVVQSYMKYVQQRTSAGFLRALRLCHDADRQLKICSYGEEVWLGKIFWELRSQSKRLQEKEARIP